MKLLRMRLIKNSFTRQLNQQDCGIACILSIMRYHGRSGEYETVCDLADLKATGTTMFNLKKCASLTGFQSEAFEMDPDHLKLQESPVILHVINSDGSPHFIVCYRYNKKRSSFLIGDPASGIKEISSANLSDLWKSRCALLLTPLENKGNKIFLNGKWKWLFSLLIHERVLLILITFLGVLIAIMGLGLSLYLQVFTDKILPQKNYQYMFSTLLIIILLFISKCFVVKYRQQVIIAMVMDFNRKLTRNFSMHLLKLPESYLQRRTTGDMIIRFNDTQRIQGAFSTAVSLILVDMVMIIAVTAFILFYSIQIGIFMMLFFLITTLLAFSNSPGLKKDQFKITSDFCNTENILLRIINAQRDRKENPGKISLAELESLGFFNFIRSTEKFLLRFKSLAFSFDMLGNLFFSCILVYASWMVMDKQFTKGEFLALITLTAGVFPVMQRICTTGMILMDGIISLERMYTMVSASILNKGKRS